MGLPEIHIEFEEKKTNFIHRWDGGDCFCGCRVYHTQDGGM